MSGWTSIKDRRPKLHENVLLYSNGAYGKDYFVGFLDADGSYRIDIALFELQVDVTHWMSLPEPPEECLK